MRISPETIDVVGLDLDQCLYPKSPVIDAAIQKYIHEQISAQKDCTLEEAKTLFEGLYQNGAGLSGSEALRRLEIEGAADIVQLALEYADIAPFLNPDQRIITGLARLTEIYVGVDLITGSNRKNTARKLASLSINDGLFNHVLTSDEASKSDGEAFRAWMEMYGGLKPSQFFYAGDRAKTDHIVPSALGIQTALVYVDAPSDKWECPQYSSTAELLDELNTKAAL